jgi:hypothetical protein
MSDEYWLISVPGRKEPQQRFNEICQATDRDQLSQNFVFTIPELLKVLDMIDTLNRHIYSFVYLGGHIGFVGRFVWRFGTARWLYRRVRTFEQTPLVLTHDFRVTKKLTQFFFNDILAGDRNRLAENLTVAPNNGRNRNIMQMRCHVIRRAARF